MSATAVREKRQTTLPAEVAEAADIHPGDQIDWRFEEGEIKGRKLAPQQPRTVTGKLVKRGGHMIFELPRGYKIDPEDIGRAVREDRENDRGPSHGRSPG
jgi:bifunctional DNA-binding transcriptional regulator/antitoxin component of YhaV-PrlF toxin-antitoxin module